MLKAYSIGGKEFTVTTSGGDVHMEWIDPPAGQEGDALFDWQEALKLSARLQEAAIKAYSEGHDV